MSPLASLANLQQHRRSFSLDDLQLNCWAWGEQGEPVLLLHGMADHGLVWANLAASLADRYQCLAPDLRGHGDSSKPAQGYSCAEIIADLEALMERVGRQ